MELSKRCMFCRETSLVELTTTVEPTGRTVEWDCPACHQHNRDVYVIHHGTPEEHNARQVRTAPEVDAG